MPRPSPSPQPSAGNPFFGPFFLVAIAFLIVAGLPAGVRADMGLLYPLACAGLAAATGWQICHHLHLRPFESGHEAAMDVDALMLARQAHRRQLPLLTGGGALLGLVVALVRGW